MDVERGDYGTFEGESRPLGRQSRLGRGPRRLAAAGAALCVLVLVCMLVEYGGIADDSRALLLARFARQKLDQAPPQQQQSPPDYSKYLAQLPSDMRKLLNTSVSPCEDFHEYACGLWEGETEIPKEKTSVSFSWDVANRFRQDGLKEILEKDQGMCGNFYRACMNVDLANSLGWQPLSPLLAVIDSIHDRPSLALGLAELHKLNLNALFSWFVGTDHLNSSRSIFYLTDGGLNLPDKAYYLDQTDEYAKHREAYRKYLIATFGMMNVSRADAEQLVNDTMAIETNFAEHTKDEDDLYKLVDVPPRYNNSALRQLIPNFDWATYFGAWGHADVGANEDILSVTRPAWFANFNSLIASQSFPSIRNYLKAHLVYYMAPMLSENFLDALTTLNGDLYGTEARPPRFKKCIGATQNSLPLPLGKLFVESLLPAGVKPAVTGMLEEIRAAFGKNLDSVSWMTPEVRAAARVKLAAIIFEVAYPSTWPVYNFVVTDHTYVDNSVSAFKWSTKREFERLYNPVDRHEWSSSPAEINAFYSNGVNGVFVPGGILISPFFNLTYPISRNYGSISSVLGHELTHGFDNTGRKYDAQGNRHKWWDDATINGYEARSQCIARLYDTYEAAGVHVHGNDTLGENIADLGGLKMSYNSFLAKAGDKVTIEDKRIFWTAFAQSWCGKRRPKSTRYQILTDEHSPGKFRIIGPLSQLEAFSQDFSCPVGSKMNPASKCVLW